MLPVDVVEVLFNAFSTVGQDFQQFLPRAIEALKEVVTDLIERLVQPMQIVLTAVFHAFLALKPSQNCQNLLAQTVVAVHKHAAKHVVGCGIKRKEILLVLTIQFSIQLLRTVGVQTLQTQ